MLSLFCHLIIEVPLIETRYLPDKVAIAIWKIEETDAYFLRLLDLDLKELEEVSSLKGRRKTEWLASRWCWKTLARELQHGPIIKDKHGKPHIQDSSWHMSISHTHEYTAVIAAPFLVGIDIQTKVQKITRLADKFLNEIELEQVHLCAFPVEYLHVYWGAKESLYKAWGRKAVDFRTQLSVRSFNLELGATQGYVLKDGLQKFNIRFEITRAYVLVYALEETL